MATKAALKKIQGIRMILPVFLILLVVACDRKLYNGSIAVAGHMWKLERVDTFSREGKYRPRAYWYNTHDRLTYVDFDHEFPYPYSIGSQIYNFDRK